MKKQLIKIYEDARPRGGYRERKGGNEGWIEKGERKDEVVKEKESWVEGERGREN